MLFSFSDLWEKLRDKWNATVKPSWQNLLSERQNTLNLLSVILILETLLCILFLSFSNNLAIEANIRAEYELYKSQFMTDANKAALRSALTTLQAGLESMHTKNTAVFVFAAVAWFLSSFLIFTKIIASSVELKKFVYGLYITFGANTKKIRSFIFCQMMTLGLISLAPALLIAALVCRGIYGFVSYDAISAKQVAWVLISFAAMLITVIAWVAHRVTAQTCVSLLSASDVSGMVKSPRRSARRVYANKPFRMASISLKRMNSHYFPVVISASLPACLFFCCMSLAISNEQRNADTITEYTLVYENGLDINAYRNGLRGALTSIEGIEDAIPNARDTADNLGLHMLLLSQSTIRSDQLVASYGGIAYDNIKIVSADYYSLKDKKVYPKGSPDGARGNSFEIPMPEEGQAILITPDVQYNSYSKFVPDFATGAETVFIASPSSESADVTLEERLQSFGGSGFSLTLKSVKVNSQYSKDHANKITAWRLDEQLLVLNPTDYERLTGIKVIENIKTQSPSPIVLLSELGSFLTVPEATLSETAHFANAPPLYASNGFTLDVADEFAYEKYGIPATTVLPTAQGSATLIRSWNSYVADNASVIGLSKTTELKIDYKDPQSLLLTATDRLSMSVNGYSQSYAQLTLCDVVYSTAIDADVLLIHELDFTEACGREGVYTDVGVEISANIPPKNLCKLLTELNMEIADPSLISSIPTVTESGELWNAITVDNGQYNSVARALALILLLAVPFIWFCPQFNFYSKRKSDLEILCAIGQPRSMVLKIMIAEGLILALRSAIASLIICPIFTVATFEFLKFNGFPFAYSSLDLRALVAVLIYSALCAFGATVVNYPILFASSKGKKLKLEPTNVGKEFI